MSNNEKYFIHGGLAAVTACLFTNPLDVVKSRLQLNGEGQTSSKTGFVKTMRMMIKSEGFVSLQKGLGSALAYQFVMNSTRLGLFGTLREKFPNSNPVVNGIIAGVTGATVASPFYQIKIQVQLSGSPYGLTKRPSLSVSSVAFKLWRGGVRDIFAGVQAAQIRMGVLSATQLSANDFAAKKLPEFGVPSGLPNVLAASLSSGIFATAVMAPFDSISTRMYNQDRSANYKGVTDCLRKTIASEGVAGLYRGFGVLCARLVPHTVFTFLFLDIFKSLGERLS